ncbi:hypothetical protein Tsubulata_008955 [Turnera subulata]|uniref:Pentacotripeptide-repeat region of PRORP domain-containing protein n=1 Tax=Turnera subulata TaxID=218843 RepID=A0A9Q0JB38_9ROSI|nr:hypothetical protein Tsubulata_008955 [Turnera subulata]
MLTLQFQWQQNRQILNQLAVLKNPTFLFSSSSSSSQPPPDPDQPSLVSDVVSLLTHRRSKSRWTYLRSLLSSTTTTALTPSQFSQIALHLKSNPHLALRFFHFTLTNPSLCSHNLRSYSTIIHILSRARLKTRARIIIRSAFGSPALFDGGGDAPVKLFEVLLRTYRECDSAPFVFDLLIKSCLDLKKIDGSIQIARMLRSRGISPQIGTCNALVSTVLREKGCFAGFGVFREVFGEEVKIGGGVRPNVHTFNALMAGFYRDGEIEMVEELWREMERFGCVPNAFSYSVLIAVFCDGGKIREALKLWEEMGVKGVKPDLVAYEVIIGGFCKIGEMEKAEDLFREMGLCEIEGSCVIYEHLVKGYSDIGDVDSAILVYKDMSRKGFRAEAWTVEALVGGLCAKKRVSEALDLLRVATTDVLFHPSGKSYEILIMALCEDGKMEEALKVQAEMVGKGFEPNPKIYGTFIRGYMKLGNEEMAAILREEMSETLKQKEEVVDHTD